MGNKELSLGFRSEPNESNLQAVARAAGRYGFDVISVYEDLGDQSPMYPLMTLSRESPNARVGPACIVVPKYKTMEPIVGDLVRLSAVSNGKAYLGIVPGSWMESVGLKSASVDQMREAVGVSRYLLEKKEDGFNGKHYLIKPGFKVNYPTPESAVPILIGAWGERMAALAGEIADEIKVGGSANPGMVEVIQKRLNVGIVRANREKEDVGIVMGAVTVVDDDREKALYLARRRAVVYIDVIGGKDPTVVSDFPEELKAISHFVAARDIDEAAKHLPDSLLRRFSFAGTPADVVKQVEELFEAGASRVELGAPHGIDQVEGIDLIGKKVLPYFK